MSPAQKKAGPKIQREAGVDKAPVTPVSREELLSDWARLYRRPPPPRLSTRLLRLAVAYKMQVKSGRGLSKATQMRLYSAAQGVASAASVDPPRAAEGTRLVREWHGRSYVVDIVADGVRYEGRTYRSLSEVARVITGARWSGPRFFGV